MDKSLEQLQTNESHEQFALSSSNISLNMSTSPTDKNKTKKMNYYRRKRQKLRLKKQEARQTLHQIIVNICGLKTSFEENEKQINQLLDVDLDEDRFYEFISKVTRQQMDILANEIYALTLNFCHLYKQNKTTSPTQIVKLYQLVSTVKHASREIEKIINFFILKVEKNEEINYFHQNLDQETLKSIVQSDPCNKDFEYLCHRFIKQTSDKRQKFIVSEIIDIFRIAKQFEESIDEVDENLECYQQLQTKQMKKKKKKQRYRQRMQHNKKQEQMEKKIQQANCVIKSLNEMIIKQPDRCCSYAGQQWAKLLSHKYGNDKS